MIAGVAFAVLYTTAVLALPAVAGADRGAARAQALLLAFAALALVFVLASARDRLTGPPAHLFTVGSAVLVANLCAAIWFTSGTAVRPGQAANINGALDDIGAMWLPAATVANILVAIPILLSANEDHLPRWLGIIAAVFTVEQLVETITIIGPPGSFISPGGPMNHYLGGTLSVAFFLALGIATSLAEGTEGASVDAPTPETVGEEPRVDQPAGE
jgi:hypothetical protein